MHLCQQVAVGGTAGTHVARTANPDTLSFVDTGGNLYNHLVGAAYLALALAGGAGVFDNLALAAALRAGDSGAHLHPHEILNHLFLTGAVALGTGFNVTVGAAGSVADCAVFNPGSADLLVAAESRFLKGQIQPSHHIFTPTGAAGTAAAGRTAAAAEQVTENVTEVTETAKACPVKSAEPGTAESSTAGTGRVVGVNTGKAILVIAGALVVVTQHLVGFAHLFELLLGFLVTGVAVRVVFHGQLAVGLLYFIG